MNPTRLKHPSAWSQDIRRNEDWIVNLTGGDVAEIEAALAKVKSRKLDIPELAREDFAIPGVARKLQQVLHQAEGWSWFRAGSWPTCRALLQGRRCAHLLGHRFPSGAGLCTECARRRVGPHPALGANWKTEMKARGYQTRLSLPFHNDSTDVVGLLCLQKAKAGGASRIVSSAAVHNKFAAQRPDLWKVMCQPFCVDRRGEESEGQKPYYVTPCFNYLDGRLFIRYNRTFIESAQRFSEVPRLTMQQRDALGFDGPSLCNSPEFYFDMRFEVGDMQFLNNYVILHSRADYEDWLEPERKRHLLRLWLRTPGFKRPQLLPIGTPT